MSINTIPDFFRYLKSSLTCWIVFSALCMGSLTGSAQITKPLVNSTLVGKVTDIQSNEPLVGATIQLEGVTHSVKSDADGKFTIITGQKFPYTLIVSYIGYETKRVIADSSFLNIQLEANTAGLDEVVVVGYGTQKKRDLTGAISSISSTDIADRPTPNLLASAQGKLSGVDIVGNNGAPGAGMTIRIRGNRSITASNDPLYVVDGIPTDVNIQDFSPEDIESMEVLKDASAVAIYGSRGANGVVMITTKRGKTGRGIVEYSGYYGVKEAQKDISLMDGTDFARYVRVSRGLSPDDDSQDENFLSQPEVDNLRNGYTVNWLDYVLRNGKQQSHQVSASGGSEQVKYYLSGSLYDEDGVIQKSDYKRYSFRSNVDANVTDRLTIGVSATVSTDLKNEMANAPYANSLTFSPLVGPYGPNGEFLAYPNPREGNITNPLLDLQPNEYTDETKKYRVFANLFGEYKLMDGLTYRLNYGSDLSITRQGQYTGTLAGVLNTASVENEQNFGYTFENILTYNKEFGLHGLNVVGLFSTQKNRFESSSSSARDIPIETSSFYDLGSAAEITGINSALTEWGLVSYMGRINYSYNNRYLLTVSGRADGSSRLSQGNKWAFFPSAAAAWVVSDESFFKSLPAVSFLKLRLGYGEVGNSAIDPYQTLGGLARSEYAFGNDPGYGYRLDIIPNPGLKWEISRTVNAGLDFGLFKGRITGSLEWYQTRTSNLLLNRYIPGSSGYSSILQNIGKTENQGWELSIEGKILQAGSGFNWSANFNIYSNNEKIVELFNGPKDDVGNNWFIGHPINVFYSFKQDGIWQLNEADEATKYGQKPGDIKIRDVNGRNANGELTNQPDGQINSDDQAILGSTVPDWSGGITNRFSYKGIDLSFQVYARVGQTLQSNFHNLGGNQWQGRYNNIRLDYWTEDHPSNTIPKPNAASAPLYADAVRYFDGSFVKIRNISLGYNLPSHLFQKAGLSAIRVYVTADNAFIFSPYKIVDPETADGIVGGTVPMSAATYVFGLNLKF